MSTTRRRGTLPPPNGGQDLAAALRGRLRTDETRTGATSATRRADTGAAAPAVRRSWYMPADTAAALAAAIDDEHFATRRSKAEIIAAIIAAGLGHRDEWSGQTVKESSDSAR